MYGGDEVSAIVVDLGTSTVKAGYAGEDTPKVGPASCRLLRLLMSFKQVPEVSMWRRLVEHRYTMQILLATSWDVVQLSKRWCTCGGCRGEHRYTTYLLLATS
jgi:hypothetical protein